jgi:ABC-2 type transport system permease protein
MIAAILRAQLLSMRLRAGARRGGAIFSALTGLIYYGFWATAAFFAMRYFASSQAFPNFLPVLSSGLMFVMLYWQVAPVISAGFGASIDLRKLLVYPIPHHKLFGVEVLLRLTTCPEMLIVLGGASIGLLGNSQLSAAEKILVFPGALFFAAMNVLLSAGTRPLLERLFLRSRMKELFIILLAMVGVLPQFLLFMNVRARALMHFAPSQLFWPWAAAARLMLDETAAPSALLLLVYVALSYLFGRWQFEHSIRYDVEALRKQERETRAAGVSDWLYRIPSRFLPDPVAAIAEKELRMLSRIPRFRTAYVMSCIFGLVLYFPAFRRPDTQAPFIVQNALPVLALYGLLMLGTLTYWNAFGFDRSAAQGYFLWPIRLRDALIAKNIAVALLLIPQIAIIALAGKFAHIPSSLGKFFETVVVILIASLYWFSLGNICSVRMPRAMNPDKMNQMANKTQALSIWAAPFLLLPIGLAYWARAVFESELIFGCLLVLAAAIGAGFYKAGLDSAVATAERKRESMLLELGRADGPLSVT